MFNLLKNKKSIIGFDVSDISLKLMYLKRSGSGYKIQAYSDMDMQPGIMVNDVILDQTAFTKAAQSIFAKPEFGKVDTDQVVASIPESKAFVRVIQIPKMDEVQAAKAVPFEIEQYIPITLDQAYIDWQIIGTNQEKMDILVTAAPKDYIDNYLNVLKKVGLRPVAFEVESAACVRSLVGKNQTDKDILICDMDTYRSSLIVVQNGYSQFSASVPIAGQAFTDHLAQGLAVPNDDAEKKKREFGLDETPEHKNVRDALAPAVDGFILEIRNILKYHNEHSTKQLDTILLSGGTSKLAHIDTYIAEKLADIKDLKISLGDPWVNITTSPPLNKVDSLSYATVIGLAKRGADL